MAAKMRTWSLKNACLIKCFVHIQIKTFVPHHLISPNAPKAPPLPFGTGAAAFSGVSKTAGALSASSISAAAPAAAPGFALSAESLSFGISFKKNGLSIFSQAEGSAFLAISAQVARMSPRSQKAFQKLSELLHSMSSTAGILKSTLVQGVWRECVSGEKQLSQKAPNATLSSYPAFFHGQKFNNDKTKNELRRVNGMKLFTRYIATSVQFWLAPREDETKMKS
jgi:hypothetical protein